MRLALPNLAQPAHVKGPAVPRRTEPGPWTLHARPDPVTFHATPGLPCPNRGDSSLPTSPGDESSHARPLRARPTCRTRPIRGDRRVYPIRADPNDGPILSGPIQATCHTDLRQPNRLTVPYLSCPADKACHANPVLLSRHSVPDLAKAAIHTHPGPPDMPYRFYPDRYDGPHQARPTFLAWPSRGDLPTHTQPRDLPVLGTIQACPCQFTLQMTCSLRVTGAYHVYTRKTRRF